MKNFFTSLVIFASLFFSTCLLAQTAMVQVIHNSPDPLASEVDVYLGSELILNDFAFRTSTPFVELPAGSEIVLTVAPSTSTSVADGIAAFPVTLTENETYVVVASGLVNPLGGFTPFQQFDLKIFPAALMTADPGKTRVLVYHGSTDAPTVDIVETSVPTGILVDDISYGSFSNEYLDLPTADYVLAVQTADNSTTVQSYSAPLATLGLEEMALVALASGFLDPSVNANGPAFGLFVSLPAGGELVELPVAITTGIADYKNLKKVNVYPNPASDYIIVSSEVENAQITDMSGTFSLNISPDANGRILVSGLQPGMYILKSQNTVSQFVVK